MKYGNSYLFFLFVFLQSCLFWKADLGIVDPVLL